MTKEPTLNTSTHEKAALLGIFFVNICQQYNLGYNLISEQFNINFG
jgi:hypothetical protein